MIPRTFLSPSNWPQFKLVDIPRWLCLIVLAFTLSACEFPELAVEGAEGSGSGTGGSGSGGSGGGGSGGGGSGGGSGGSTASDQQIFEMTLYPKLRDQANFCVVCHGVIQDPAFAVADVAVAHNTVVSQQKVNLSNPALSRIYLRAKNDRHNCGGVANCDLIAADFLAAIQDWASQAASAGGGGSSGGGTGAVVVSAKTTFAQATAGGAVRADANAIALFTFSEGSGNVAMDTGGVGAPIALQIEGMEWVDGGGLRNVSGKAQASVADSRKLFDMITPGNAYSVEAWVIPDNIAQDGPARIVSYSLDTGARNFTLGQNSIYYQLRNRSAGTGINGTPALEALAPLTATVLQHVVTTFDAASGRKVYINGQLAIAENTADSLAWLDNFSLVLGNEVTNNRLWKGVIKLVAIHNKALTALEIQQNFDAGSGSVVTMRFDVSNMIGQAAYIDMQVAQLDAVGYMFAKPVFISDASGITIKNIRIAVNDTVPVAAQPFRRVDTVVLSSGTELSPLGAVIPVELGSDTDQFHLEFEVLGTQFGLAELVAASSPPAPMPDTPEPELGLRTFSQINDTMSSLTGIDANQTVVSASYADLRDSLPPTSDMLSFAAAKQIAIQRLAISYCGAVVNNAGNCGNFFGACTINANAKAQVATTLYDRLIGDNIANQPERAGVTTEIVRTIDDLGCAGGCSGVTAQTVLQATCAAVLSSGAVTVN